MFCTIFIPLSVAKDLEEYIRSNLFQGKLTFTWKIYWTAISIEIILHQIFRTDIFQNSYFLLVIENQQNLSAEVKN